MSHEKKDDPQIHLLAAQHCDQIRNICVKKPKDVNDDDVKILVNSIKFFSRLIKYLPECSNDVLNICRCYTNLLKEKIIKLDFVGINRIIVVCTTMMIRRKEDSIIRSTCAVLKEILKLIPRDALKRIVNRYSKTLGCIFQKMYFVMTFYTQQRILDIFVFITNDLKQLREETITKHQLMKHAKPEILSKIIKCISNLEQSDFINTSRKFLKFFNNYLFPKTNILSLEGSITKINDQMLIPSKNLMITFNGRNLTVSFFVPSKMLSSEQIGLKKNTKCQVDNENDLIFIEFDCKSFDLEDEIDNGEPFILANITVNQVNTDDDAKCPVKIDEIKTISFKLRDDENILERFKGIFYQKFKSNEPMIADNASFVDRESIMTFETSASMNDEMNYLKESKEDKRDESQCVIENMKVHATIHEEPKKKINEKAEVASDNKKIESTIVVKKEVPQKVTKAKVSNRKAANKKQVIEAPNELLIKSRPKRQNAKKVDYKMLEDIYNEDNMPELENVKITYGEFKATQSKKKSKEKSSEIESDSENSNAKYYLSPPTQPVTRTTVRLNKTASKSTKTLQKLKTKHYCTEESEDENQENNRSVKPKVNSSKPVKEEKAPKKRANALISNGKRINIKLEGQKKVQETAATLAKKEIAEPRKTLTAKSNNNLKAKNNDDLKPLLRKLLQHSNKLDPTGRNANSSVINNLPDEIDENEFPIVNEKPKLTENAQKPKNSRKRKMTAGSIEPPVKLTRIETVEKKKPLEKHVSNSSKQLPNIDDFEPSMSEISSFDHEIKKPPVKETFANPKPRKITKDNVFQICMMEDENRKNSLVEEWLDKVSDSLEFGVSDQIDSSMSAILGNYQKAEAVEKLRNEVKASSIPQNSEESEYDSDNSYEGLQNDEHQHYSSSSQESIDLDLQNTAQDQIQKNDAIGTLESAGQIVSQNYQMNYRIPFSFVVDPCKIFEDRSKEVVTKLNARRMKLIENEKEVLSKHDQIISIYGKKYYDQIQKTKRQLSNVTQLHDRFERAKSKLMDEVGEQEKMGNVLKREVAKRREVSEFHKQIKKKELLNLKKEAVRKNEELMNDIWREYIDGFHSSFNTSLKKAYEI